jgi:hypothetical protein
VQGAAVLTKLSGTLTPAEMREDLELTWEEYAHAERRLHTPSAARTVALNTGSGMALLAIFVAALLGAGADALRLGRRVPRPDRSRSRRRAAAAWLFALVFGLSSGVFQYVALDVIDAPPVTVAGLNENARTHSDLADRVASTSSPAEARAVAAEVWRGRTNPYDGRPVREEDSPGNYAIRAQDGKPVYVTFDAHGAEFGYDR